MKVQWLNEERTEALVTRGFLWWRRQALVYEDYHWRYSRTKDRCDDRLNARLDKIRNRVRAREYKNKVWLPVSEGLPTARLEQRQLQSP